MVKLLKYLMPKVHMPVTPRFIKYRTLGYGFNESKQNTNKNPY